MSSESSPPGKRQLFPEEWMYLTQYFVGNNYRYRENIIIPRNLGPVAIKTHEEKMVESFVESCPFKVMMSCVAGKKKAQITESLRHKCPVL